MTQQAIITLTAITPGIVPPKRVLRLNPECLSVPIGRASKSVSKGLLSAENNGWIDNPVMSRDHAELILHQEDMAIMIQDVQSMHGTQVNNEKLLANVPQAIKIGDVLSFGAEVRRGPELFPPCSLRIDYEFMPWTRGFQFPEDSPEIEDEQDNSEEEGGCIESQEDETTPMVESPIRKQSTTVDAIDLTKDDSDLVKVSTSGQIISAEGDVKENPIVVEGDYDEEDEDDLEIENERLDYDDSEGGSEDDSDKENNEETDESHDEVDDTCGNVWESSEIVDTECDLNASRASGIPPTHGRIFQDNKDIPVSNIRTTAGGSKEGAHHTEINFYNKTKDDVDWDDGLSDDIDDDYLSHDEGVTDHVASEIQRESNSNIDTTPPLGSCVQPTIRPSGSSSHASVRQPSPSDAAMAKSMNQCFGNPSPSKDISNTQTINPVQIQHLPGHRWNQFLTQTFGEKSGKYDFFQAREINRARVNDEEPRHTEHNFVGDGVARAKFNLLGHPYNPRPSAPSPIQNTDPLPAHFFQRQQHVSQRQISQTNAYIQPRMFQQQMALKQQAIQQQMAQAHAAAQQQMAQTQATAQQQIAQAQVQAQQRAQTLMAEQSPFKQSDSFAGASHHNIFATLGQQPCIEPNIQTPPASVLRAPSPELDMTSAVRFNQSKQSLATENPAQPGRSAVSINDIVEPPAVDPTPKPLKRKASDISDVIEEEVRVWASKDSSISTGEVGTSSDTEVLQIEKPPSTEALPSPVPVDPAPLGPAYKKLKKFAEVVGYTALGGLAGGVALFSTLVATAPDFL